MKIKKVEDLQPSKENFLKLKEFVENEGENDCRDKFLDFAEVLADLHNLKLEAVCSEVCASIDGKRADIVLCCSEESDSKKLLRQNVAPIPGTELDATSQRYIIVYECKSPKRPIFKKDKSLRYVPSPYLIEAETQMIEYVNHLTISGEHFKQELNNSSYSKCIAIKGGMIIGKKYEDDHDKSTGSKTTSDLRRDFLYKEAKINMLAWEELLFKISRKYGYGYYNV